MKTSHSTAVKLYDKAPSRGSKNGALFTFQKYVFSQNTFFSKARNSFPRNWLAESFTSGNFRIALISIFLVSMYSFSHKSENSYLLFASGYRQNNRYTSWNIGINAGKKKCKNERITVRAKPRILLLPYCCKTAQISFPYRELPNCRKKHAPGFNIKGIFEEMLPTVPSKLESHKGVRMHAGRSPTSVHGISSSLLCSLLLSSPELYFPNWGHQNSILSTI